jgi:hypothetical protein
MFHQNWYRISFTFNKAHSHTIAHNTFSYYLIFIFTRRATTKKHRTRHSKKFKAPQNVFNVTIKELPEKENSTFIRRLFGDIILTSPNDYIQINIDHEEIKKSLALYTH